MTSVSSADVCSVPAGALARLAYTFVRAQIDIVSVLMRLLRNQFRGTAILEEEQW